MHYYFSHVNKRHTFSNHGKVSLRMHRISYLKYRYSTSAQASLVFIVRRTFRSKVVHSPWNKIPAQLVPKEYREHYGDGVSIYSSILNVRIPISGDGTPGEALRLALHMACVIDVGK